MKSAIEHMREYLSTEAGLALTPSERLRYLEDLAYFVQKNAPELFDEGEYYPVRKTVGRVRGWRVSMMDRAFNMEWPS